MHKKGMQILFRVLKRVREISDSRRVNSESQIHVTTNTAHLYLQISSDWRGPRKYLIFEKGK